MMSLRLILRDMIYVFECEKDIFFLGKMFFIKIGKIKLLPQNGFETHLVKSNDSRSLQNDYLTNC